MSLLTGLTMAFEGLETSTLYPLVATPGTVVTGGVTRPSTYTPGSPIIGNLQPVTGEEALTLNQTRGVKLRWKFLTREVAPSLTTATRARLNGVDYAIEGVTSHQGQYQKIMLVREGSQ